VPFILNVVATTLGHSSYFGIVDCRLTGPLALISFLPAPADGAIEASDRTSNAGKQVAKKSIEFGCAKCGPVIHLLCKSQESSGDGEGDDD
jgi:hypothetical protein